MQTWESKYEGRWGSDYTAKVAAKNFTEAIKKVKRVARREGNGKRIKIISLVRTATLDA